MVATRVSRSSAVEARAPDNVDSPTRKRRWAYTVPMTGVRYYRFLPDVTDPAEPVEPDSPETVRNTPGRDPEPSVRGGS